MRADKMDTESLLLDETFINYCKGSSVKDVAFWEDYLKNNPADAECIQHAKESFFQLFDALALSDLDKELERLNNKLSVASTAPVVTMEKPDKQRWGNFFRLKMKVAAVAVFLIGVSVTVYLHYAKNSSPAFKFFEAAYGERKNVQLPDGSLVTLNSGSAIKINHDFGVTSREVCLRGEAFFDVKHNPALPFIVHTKAMDIKALGTAFNVKAYRNDGITETSLIKGLVEVTLKEDKNSKMLLYPNEKIKWQSVFSDSVQVEAAATKKSIVSNENGRSILKEKIAATDDGIIKEIAWKANKLVFEDQSFDEIAVLLERWYAVKFNFKDNAIRSYHFTGLFEKEELNTVLDFLKESRNFNYSYEQGEIKTINLSK